MRNTHKHTMSKENRRKPPDEPGHNAAHASGAARDHANSVVAVQAIEQQRVCALAHGLQHQAAQNQREAKRARGRVQYLHVFKHVVELAERVRLGGNGARPDSAVVLCAHHE